MSHPLVSLSDVCTRIYAHDGAAAVQTFISTYYPEVRWGACVPCEDDQPLDRDGSCLVCGDARRPVARSGPSVVDLMARLAGTFADPHERDRVNAILDGICDDITADNEGFTYGARLWDSDLKEVTVLYPKDVQPGYVKGVPSGPVVIWWETTNGMADGSRLALKHPVTRRYPTGA